MNRSESNDKVSMEVSLKDDNTDTSVNYTGNSKTVTSTEDVEITAPQIIKQVSDEADNRKASPGSIMMSSLALTDRMGEDKVDNAGNGNTQLSFTRMLPTMVPILYDSNGNVNMVAGGSGGGVEAKTENITELSTMMNDPSLQRSNTVPLLQAPKNPINLDVLQAAIAGTFAADPTIRKPTLPLPVGTAAALAHLHSPLPCMQSGQPEAAGEGGSNAGGKPPLLPLPAGWTFQAGNSQGYYTNDYLAPGTPQKRKVKEEEMSTPTKTPSRTGMKLLVEVVAPLKEKKYLVLKNPAFVESAL